MEADDSLRAPSSGRKTTLTVLGLLDVDLRRGSVRHWGGLGRSARGAGFGSLWRAGGGRRGASGGRHLRDPGLRAQEAARLWLAFRRGSAGCTALWLEGRSEEHTSELQSLMRISYAVFCLKKKKMK